MLRKRTIKNICVHLIKFIFIIAPMILLFVCAWHNNNDVYPVPKYAETNSVSTIDDLKDGNIYHIKFDFSTLDESTLITINLINTYGIYNINATTNPVVNIGSNTYGTIPYFYYAKFNHKLVISLESEDSSIAGIEYAFTNGGSYFVEFDFVFKPGSNDFSYVPSLIQFITPSDYQLYLGTEITGLFGEITSFFENFVNLPLNIWYLQLLQVLGITFSLYNILGIICFMPLWILYVNLFELFLDFLLFIPRLAHKWLHNGYGDE